MSGVAPSVDATPSGSSSSEMGTDVGASSSTDENVASTVPAGSDEAAGMPVMPNDDGNGSVAVPNEIDDSGVVQGDDVGVPVPAQPSGNNDGSIVLTVDSGGAAAGSVTFQRIELTREFLAEGANGGDFDRDGVMDVVAGPYLYRGPDFKSRHVVYLPQSESEPVPFDVKNYSDHFFSFVDDFNGDGWPDLLVIDFPGRGARWYENPQTLDTVWSRHAVFDAVGNESPAYVDVNADGQRELVFASDGALGWAAPSTVPTEPWVFQALTPAAGFGPYDHGLGVSDVDGDGDMDLIEPFGWWEQPDNEATVWTQHEHAFGNGGAQMFAYDVDGDGDQDIVTTLEAHEYGVAWFERTGDGTVAEYTMHLISSDQPGPDSLFQPHALDVVDINGDGLLDIVTGERFWAHVPEGDPNFDDPAKLIWYELRRGANGVDFIPHVIDDDSGVGTQVVAMDLNADQRLDIVVASKKGAFVFLQQVD